MKKGFIKFLIVILIAVLISLFIKNYISGDGGYDYFFNGVYEITTSAPESGRTVSNEKYAYSQLDDKTKKVYDQMLDCVMKMNDSVKVSTRDTAVVDLAANSINADYGEIFWLKNYTYETLQIAGINNSITVKPGYTMTKNERDSYQERIDKVVDAWLAKAPTGGTDYEKSKWVYETLINNVDYVENSPNDQNIISVFLNNRTVCKGYSCAANYLLNKLGIQSIVVVGTAEGGPHAWNMVKLDNEYYFMDVTWGNSNYSGRSGSKSICYNTLNATTKDLVNHQIDMAFALPECIATRDNYFVQEGLYFTTFDKDKMGKLLHNGYVQRKDVSFKCSNSSTYNEMKRYFIEKGHFADYCSGKSKITYYDYPDNNAITFVLK